MTTLKLVELGYAGDVDLPLVCRIINRAQKSLKAKVGTSVATIGEPDISGIAYTRASIFSLLPDRVESEILIGVTHAPLSGNLFSMTTPVGEIVPSLHGSYELCELSGRTLEEYIAQSALSEFLQIRFCQSSEGHTWADLVHDEVRGCLFDFVPHKPDKVHKLRRGWLDPQCRAKLINAGVADDEVPAAEAVIRAIQRPTLVGSFLDGIKRPGFGILLGGLAGGGLVNLVTTAITNAFSATILVSLGVIAVASVALVLGNWIQAMRAARARIRR
ncbi:hypothetical protein [Actinokineospora cianjurensis]|uniref:hypothetical protein n=1 Tax=Actinokineospora cianjurensis TaxID=585224 RepID=UPI0011C45A76|nr:hypothetical protein [Actinokineospora cianjurensis]